MPTEVNPGYDTSLGLAAEGILLNKRWTCGPGLLKDYSDSWPDTPSLNSTELVSQIELKRALHEYSVRTHSELDNTVRLLHQYSSWYCLKKAVL